MPVPSSTSSKRILLLLLHFYIRPILKGKSDIFFIKNCDKVNQAVPLLFIEFRGHAVLPFQFCKEPFYLFLFRLLLSDGIANFIQPCLRPVEPLCQPVIPCLIFRLVEGDMGVLTYALLYQIQHNIQFFRSCDYSVSSSSILKSCLLMAWKFAAISTFSVVRIFTAFMKSPFVVALLLYPVPLLNLLQCFYCILPYPPDLILRCPSFLAPERPHNLCCVAAIYSIHS